MPRTVVDPAKSHGDGAPASHIRAKPASTATIRLAKLSDAFDACAIGDGSVLSFHHHLRNGDAVLNAVLAEADRRQLQGLQIAASSLFPVHAPLVEHMASGRVTKIWTSYMNGPVADAISRGVLNEPTVLQSHGSRAQAIAKSAILIDVAFIGAPATDPNGALTGAVGAAACGPLGYGAVDAAHARHVVGVFQEEHSALPRCEIPSEQVDFTVEAASIGDPSGISSGTTRIAQDPVSVSIAENAAAVIEAAGRLKQGLSFQTGAGGVSLATAGAVGRRMRKAGIRGSFVSGGICKIHVDLVHAGLFEMIYDVQCFDRPAVSSYARDPWHHAMSAAQYASPLEESAIASRLDVMILGASEIDRDFNINVTTAGDGRIIGGPGGHPDTAHGAKLSIATTRLVAAGFAKVVDRVATITTPGCDVDVLVTEAGIAVNPACDWLEADLKIAGLEVRSIDALIESASEKATRQRVLPQGPVIAVVEDRQGGVLDSINGVG